MSAKLYKITLFLSIISLTVLSFNQVVMASSNPGGACAIDSVVVTNSTCFGQCSGTISVYAQGSGPLFYQWPGVPGADSSFISGLCAGTYNVIITDSTGCVTTDSVEIVQPAPIGFNLSVVNATCPGGCSGSVEVTLLDTLPYLFQWPGYIETGPVLSSLCEGSYVVVITNMQGCSIIGSAQVGYDPPFDLTFNSNPVSCPGICNGTAFVTANGIPPFTYQWGTGPIQTTQNAVNLCAGAYAVNVSDSTGCVVTDSVQIQVMNPPVISFVNTSPTCYGGCDGQAEISVIGGGNYEFEWSTFPVQDSAVAINLCAGIHYIQITDILSGCVFVDSVEILNPTPPTITFGTTPSFCDNFCSGTATAFSSGPVPHTFLWQSGSTSSTDTSLCPGIYSVTITDGLGCSTTASITVTSQELLFNTIGAFCNTVCNGSAEVIFPTGTGWQVTWFTSPIQNTQIADSLCEGNYTVMIQDITGCQVSAVAEIDASQPISISYDAFPVSCPANCDGSINVVATGNNPFNFEWPTLPGQTNDSLGSLCGGVYPLIVTDSSGCELHDSISVASSAIPQFSFSSIPNTCHNICDASAVITPDSAGTYTYEWLTTPPQFGASASDLCPFFTFVQITDSIGCTFLDSVLILGPDPIFISINEVNPSCVGTCDGFLDCVAFGGTPGFDFIWSNGFVTQQVLNICAGTYTVTVTDASGCTAEASSVLTAPDSILISFTVTDASCPTCSDGSITALVSGGIPGYNYFWTPGGVGGATLDSLVTGTYSLCIADANLCIWCEDAFVSFSNSIADDISASHNVAVFPNPVSETAIIEIKETGNFTFSDLRFEWTDLTGRKINNFEIQPLSNTGNMIRLNANAGNVIPGVYLLRITLSNSYSFTTKIMVQH